MEIENHSGPYNTSNLPYLSGISNVSSFFEDGFQNVCFSDEKKMMHTLDPLFKGSSASDEGKKIRSFSLRNEFENTSEANGENGNHILNSQYFPGERLVVVTGGNYTLEKHKPLGLPIRSLRSRIPGGEKLQFAYSNGPNSSSKICSNNENEESVEKIRGMTPTNLGCKFEEVTGHSSIPWKSRSVKMEMREEDVVNGESPGHSRPYNVVEFEIMPQHNSRSSLRTLSSSTSRSSCSSSSSKSSPVSPELSDMKTGSLGHKIDLNSSVEVKGFSSGSCCSCSSSLELDMQKISEEDMKGGIRRNGKEHLFNRGKPSSSEPVSPDAANKPSNISKILSRAKSVRTFRSGKYVMEKMRRKDEVRTVDDQSAAATIINPKDSPPQADIQKQNCDKDHHSLMRRSPVFPEKYQKRENQRPVDSNLAYEEEDSGSSSSSPCESCNDQDSSSDENENENENGNVSAEVDKEEDLAGSEVDRKADEFIAKFREQIRLQKIGSIRKQCS